MLPPATHTPLIALPALVLDLETTGLDVRGDRIVQVAAIEMQGDTRSDDISLETLVNPEVEIPARSSAIHNIFDSDIVDAPLFTDITEELRALLTGRVIVGHNIGFDVAILRHEFARLSLPWHEPAQIDIGQLLGALQPALPDIGLETVASTLDIRIQNRHSAAGDCIAAADAWAKLVPMLRDREIRTLGEAQSLANERQDLVLHQTQAGWFAVPGELVVEKAMLTAPRIDSFVFEKRLADVMSSPVKIVSEDTSLRDVAHAMIDHNLGAMLVGEKDKSPIGIITERDLLRIAAKTDADLDTMLVSSVMSTPVERMRFDEMLYRALGRMDRTGLRHLCVVDKYDVPLGMVSQRDLLQHRARGPDMLSDALAAANDVSSLAAAYSQLTPVALRLLSESLEGIEIARVVSSELQGLTRRATQLCMAEMEAEGFGVPPADWCVIILGSGGRGESLLGADQDNALIHTGTDDDDAWFAEFGRRLADFLDASGIPRCTGDVMVSSKLWRGSIQSWNQRVDNWLRRAQPQDILNVVIFFDLMSVAGNTDLARRVHTDAVRVASRSPTFLGLLAQSVRSVAPRFSLFGGLPVENGRTNLKRDGLLPLVCLARTLALRVGSRSRATPERLRDTVAAGRLGEKDAERLIDLHALILTLILRQQLEDIEQGIPTSSSILVRQLDREQQTELKQGLRHLDTIVSEIQSFISS